MRQESAKKWSVAVIGVILLVMLDQFTKYLAVLFLKAQEAIPVIKNVFELSYVENRGAAFGMLENRQWFFILITIVIGAGVIWCYHKLPAERHFIPVRICLITLMAGAVGNLIDRVRLNYVVDFLYFKLIDFPVFNVADIYVTVSMTILVILLLFYYKEDEIEQIMKK